MWVSKDDFYELQAEYYDEDNKLINKEFMSDIKQMGDRKLPSHMEMIPVDKEGNKTTLDFIDMKYNVDLNTDFFSPYKT